MHFDREEGDHTFAGQGVHFDLEGSATSTGGGAYLKQWNGAI